MNILSIDTSCDETSVAVTSERRVLSNVIYSQVLVHKQWGGVVPSLAKRAHEERIDFVINEALKKCRMTMKDVDYIAVTYGPGLAIALEVGIKTAKELATVFNKKIIPVNHMEGHIYSCFVQNSQGKPKGDFNFPYIALLISGGHTELVLFRNHCEYEIIGATVDDAAGEALDKAAKVLGLGYPGGAVVERLASRAGNKDYYNFPRPMLKDNTLNFSFSGLKTAFYYFTEKMGEEEKTTHLEQLSSSFQEAVFDCLLKRTEKAMQKHEVNRLIVGGGVVANMYLRKLLRNLTKKSNGTILFPTLKYLTGDNAAMIGVAAHYIVEKRGNIVPEDTLDRVPRLSLNDRF